MGVILRRLGGEADADSAAGGVVFEQPLLVGEQEEVLRLARFQEE